MPRSDASAESSGPTSDQLAHYFDSTQVDREAEPVPDWNLDAEAMFGLGVRRLVVRIFIDDRGHPQRCELAETDPAEMKALVRPRVEGQLCKTSLRPAERAGHAVHSVRRLEMILAR